MARFLRSTGQVIIKRKSALVGNAFYPSLTETVAVTDVLLKTPSKALTETLTLSDVLNKLIGKVLAEVLTITDVLSAFKTKVVALTETLTLSDTLLKTSNKVLTETIVLTDTLVKAISKIYTETLTFTDTLLKNIGKVLTETLTLTDVLTAVKNVVNPIINFAKQLLLDSLSGKVIALGFPTMPTWNTSGRPSSPKTGTMGYNTDTPAFEIYNGSTWKTVTLS